MNGLLLHRLNLKSIQLLIKHLNTKTEKVIVERTITNKAGKKSFYQQTSVCYIFAVMPSEKLLPIKERNQTLPDRDP